MSFDLLAFPPPGPRDLEEVSQLREAAERRLVDYGGPSELQPGPEMAVFIDELTRRWPGLDGADPGASPWTSWPLWQAGAMEGGGVELNISWSHAEAARPVIVEIARSAKITIFDPQTEELLIP